jgi:hypothetical protein
VILENCQNVKVYVDHVLASVEVLNCKKIEVNVKEQLRQFSIERSEGV